MRCPSCRYLLEDHDAWFCPACEQLLDLSVLAKQLLPRSDDFADQLRTEIASVPRTRDAQARAVVWDAPASQHTEEVPAIHVPLDDTDANDAKTRIAPEVLRAPVAIAPSSEGAKTAPVSPAPSPAPLFATPSGQRRAPKLPPPPPPRTTPVPIPVVEPAPAVERLPNVEPLPIVEPLTPLSDDKSFVPPAALSEQLELGTVAPEVARVASQARKVALREPPPLDLPRDTPAGPVRAVPPKRDITQKKDVEAILAEKARQRASSDDDDRTISPPPRAPKKKK